MLRVCWAFSCGTILILKSEICVHPDVNSLSDNDSCGPFGPTVIVRLRCDNWRTYRVTWESLDTLWHRAELALGRDW